MDNLLSELKRRHIFRVAAAYAVVAWVLLQLVANVSPMLDLPPWIGRTVLLLLVLGFPVALLFAWIHQLAPAEGAPAPASTGRLDWFLAGALVIVIVLVSYQQLTSPVGDRAAQPEQQASVAAARQASLSPAGAISIAVLPFANLSSEEITSALAKIADLRVVARTSAFQFKGEKKDMRAVGQALGATHLIEGSVRKAGDRLRITAQLIKSDDGTHIWSENYDRDLTDVFAIQEDIARAIAASLRMPLGLDPGERLVSNRTIDAESYQQYLRAKPLVRARAVGIPEATKILEPLVARHPDYAPALALLADAYGLTPNYVFQRSVEELRRAVDVFFPKAEAAAQRAIQLDPSLPDGYSALGRVQLRRGKWLLAQDVFAKALALDPNAPDTLAQYSNLLANVGHLKEALAMKQQLRALEPYVPGFNRDLAEILWLNGQNDAAIALLKEAPSDDVAAKIHLAQVYAATGRYSEGADVLQTLNDVLQTLDARFPAVARLLRTAPAESASPQSPSLVGLGFVFLHVGAPNRVLEYYEETAEAGVLAPGGMDNAFLWHPSYATVRMTERFKSWIRAVGLVDYWRARGWPDLCRPVGADDFVCD